MNFINRCLVYAFLIFLPSSILAQIEGPFISYFSRESYKGGTQNWSITSNSNGLVYFGNNKGLLEYDGDEWSLYPLPNRTIVRSLKMDSLGSIYVGGQNEIGVFRNSDGMRMQYESLSHLVPEAYKDFEDVWETFAIDNKLYFCSEKAVFIIQNNEVNAVLPVSGRFENFFEVGESIYLQDSESGLFELIDKNLKKILDPDLYNNDRIVNIIATTSGTEILITEENGMHRIVGNELISVQGETDGFIKEHKAYCSMLLKNGEIFIGTVQNGYVISDIDGQIKLSQNKRTGLANNTILCAYEDNDSNLWLGLDNGINHAELSSPFNFVNSINGLEGTGYTAFRKDGALYLGTNQGLFKQRVPNYDFSLISNSASQIWGHSVFRNKFFIHAHEGTFVLEDDELSLMSEITGSWKMIELESRPGIYLQGTYEGFFVYEWLSGEAPELIGKLKGFDESSRIFEEDNEGNIWISHAYRGLYKIRLSTDGKEIVNVKRYGSKDGLPEDYYLTVSKIRGEIVFTTSKGMYQFDDQNEKFSVHTGLTELIGENVNVQRIIEDEGGNVWFCTDSEFGQISIVPDGLYNEVETKYLNEIQENLVDGFEDVFMLDDHIAFIPIESGFIKYDMQKALQEDFNNPLIIRGIYEANNPDSLIIESADNSGKIELASDQNNLVIHYVAPSYRSFNSTLYQYRLLGFNDKWSNWNSSTNKEFNNLESGKYTFQVRAKNSYQTQTPITELEFRVLPPWYLTNVAKAVYIVLLNFGLFILYRLVKMREVRKRLAFEEESQETLEQKEAELKLVSERSENEIVKLRNEKLRADIRHKNSELASTTMHLVQKSEILQKIKNDLAELSENAKNEQVQSKIKQIERTIDADVRLDKNWERFESHFDQVHENFFKNLRAKYPNLTPKDQKLCAYLRMNLSTKEVAPLLNISVRGVEISRYRLRKKLNLSQEENLVAVIMDI